MKTEHAEDARPLDEAALVTAAQHDRAAFGPLYERYVDQIYRDVFREVDNHVDAEDLTTQTFRQARATLSDFEQGGTPFGAWLAAIARDLIAQHQGKPDVALDERTSDPATSEPAWGTPHHHEADDLVTALRQLPLEQQRAIVLKFARGYTNREIAEALNRREDEVKQLIHRALIALRAALESK